MTFVHEEAIYRTKKQLSWYQNIYLIHCVGLPVYDLPQGPSSGCVILLGANPIRWFARSNTTTLPSMDTSPRTVPDGFSPILRQWKSLQTDTMSYLVFGYYNGHSSDTQGLQAV